MKDALIELILTHQNRPISIAMVASALFVPSSLTIFLSRPELYSVLGLNGVILFSLALSLPIVVLCYGICYTPMSALVKVQKLVAGQLTQPDLAEAIHVDDWLEWPCLFVGGWIANFVLYLLVAIAYFHPLRLGATFLLVACFLFAVWIVVWAASIIFYSWCERESKKNTVPT